MKIDVDNTKNHRSGCPRKLPEGFIKMKAFERFLRSGIREIGCYIPGKPIEEVQAELGLSRVIKMASNENPLGVSPIAIGAMERELINALKKSWELNEMNERHGNRILKIIIILFYYVFFAVYNHKHQE